MFKVICKIWQFIVKIFKMVVDAIVEVLGFVLKAVMQLGSELWRGLFGSGGFGIGGLVGLIGMGLLGWWLWGVYSDKKENEEQREHELELARISRGAYEGTDYA